MTTSDSEAATESTFTKYMHGSHLRTDRMFLYLLFCQWVLAIAIALSASPWAWSGKTRAVHEHLYVALVVGGLINALPIALIYLRPGSVLTRHVVAVAQMLSSGLLIHLTGGRIETHFHIFGGLAFLAFYRDWKILITATVVVASDHFLRAQIWPESIYGNLNPEWWRFLEHSGWIAFEDAVLIVGCLHGIQEKRALAEREDQLALINIQIESEVREKTAQLEASIERLRALIETTHAVPWEVDVLTNQLTFMAPPGRALFGELSPGANAERLMECVVADDRQRLIDAATALNPYTNPMLDIEYRITDPAKQGRYVRTTMTMVCQGSGIFMRGLTIDITASKNLELELRQAQKLESVGRLAAGVAHEINTPVQFVGDSLHFIRDASRDLMGLIQKYHVACESMHAGGNSQNALDSVNELAAEIDLDYLRIHLPKAVDRSLDGLDRVASIVRSMKEFAHPDQRAMTSVDLNRAVESTLTIARNEYKYIADLELTLEDLPPVMCYAGEINQVVLNLVVNAAHAIESAVAGTPARGTITVRTRRDGDSVVLSIGDTGTGIPSAVADKIFEPFFTTKPVGKGTGQGLAIARSVVVDKHHGELRFETAAGKGTTFFIRIPIEAALPPALDNAGVEKEAA